MPFLRRIFGSVDRAYLIRAYIISFAIFAFCAAIFSRDTHQTHPFEWVFFIVNTILFPFSKLVWDEIMALLLGRNMFFLPAIFLMLAKLMINIFLWGGAIFVAPLGILWLWYRTREA